MKPEIEYSGGSYWGTTPDQVAVKLRHAPAWVLKRANVATGTAPARPRQTVRPPAAQADARRSVGWLAGCVCPGVSKPAYSSQDSRTLPEQFTDACWRSMLRQTLQQEKPIPLKLGHKGEIIATTRNLDVVFHIKRGIGSLMGLEFEARLKDDAIGRRVLDAAKAGLGVSIGYRQAKQWHVERDGVGTVRVIDDCVLDHVAILLPSDGMEPSYPAARCYSGVGRWMACPVQLHEHARAFAYEVLKRQAGCRA
jgi:hypothetical protein